MDYCQLNFKILNIIYGMRIFRKSNNDAVNHIGRKSGIPNYSIGSKLDLGNKFSQRLDEYGTANEEREPKSDLEKQKHHHRRR